MAANSVRSRPTTLGPRIKHRSISPTLALILMPPSMTQDDVIYGAFIENLRNPFQGRVFGLKKAPPELICGNLVFDIVEKRLRQETRCPLLMRMKRALQKFGRRLRFASWRVLDAMRLGRKRDYFKDPESSVFNQRVELSLSVSKEKKKKLFFN